MSTARPEDFPTGLKGGEDLSQDDHRLGETRQHGPDAGKIDRAHPAPGSASNEGEDRAERAAGDGGASSGGLVKPS